MNDTLIYWKYKVCLKKYIYIYTRTDAVFNRNEQWMKRWFVENMRCSKSIQTEDILPKQKWTMNETLIFFKIRAGLKECRDWSCIYQDRNEQQMKCWFSSKYDPCLKKSRDWSCIYQDRNVLEPHHQIVYCCIQDIRCMCPACLVRLAWIVFVMGARWPYSWCLVGCCRQVLFNIARNILV